MKEEESLKIWVWKGRIKRSQWKKLFESYWPRWINNSQMRVYLVSQKFSKGQSLTW